MPTVISDKTFYRRAEVCRIAGVRRNTLFRRPKDGLFCRVGCRDWWGWRIFKAEQLQAVRSETGCIVAIRPDS